MNWYKMFKIAYPWGRVKCVHCGSLFANDFGAHGGNGNSNTQNVNNHPFKDVEQKTYNPVTVSDPAMGDYEASTHTVERGDQITQCPKCNNYMQINYEMDPTKSDGADFFSQVSITDIEPVDEHLVGKYESAGMPVGQGADV